MISQVMTGEWISALRVAHGLHIIDMHARLQDIKSAGGEFNTRDVTINGAHFTEYTLYKAPRVERWDEDARAQYNAWLRDHQPAPNALSWVPPPAFDRERLMQKRAA
ncbi:MAG: hypothetical protein ACRDAM_10055 [Casimicrobium sp.]